MKIGIAQINCQVGDVEANCRTIASMVKQAAKAGCGAVVLPEMADTGYEMEAICAHASTWDAGPCEMLRKLARSLAIAVICGLSERDEDRIYNSVALIDEAGNMIGKYRKAHLFSASPVYEHRHLARGESLTLVRLGGFTIGVLVCYDIRFPEMARALTLRGAEVIVAPAAFPLIRLEHWKTLTACRAIENQVYLVAANRTGSDGPLTFCGTSRLLDPHGTAVACASEVEQTLIVGELSRERIEQTRSSMHVFEDRREELYGSLLQHKGRS